MTFTKATTPESKIQDFMGISSFDGISCQYIGTAYVVNTRDMRMDFDRDGNFISCHYTGNDELVNPDTFDWDSLD